MENSWLLISAFMVFIMQAGFLCLETGAYSGDDEHPFWSEREHLNVPALG